MITKNQLLTKYKTEVEIANLFGITKGAVNQWPKDKPLSKSYEYDLRHDIDPELWLKFNPQKTPQGVHNG